MTLIDIDPTDPFLPSAPAGCGDTITLKGSSDGGKPFDLVPKTVSGEVGENISAGTGKRMVWEALKDVEELSGERFVFSVTGT